MKRIEFKVVKLNNPSGKEIVLDYKKQLYLIAQTPLDPEKGADFDDIHRSGRVMDALNKANDGFVEMEDADFEYLMKKVETARFTFIDPKFEEFKISVMGDYGTRPHHA
jgi:hypothetical protein